MAASGPAIGKHKATPKSDMIGTLIAAFAKLSIFQPIDTIASNALIGKEKVSQFFSEFTQRSWSQKIRMLYSGATVELMKKLPSNSYRYPAQRAAQSYIDQHHHARLCELFGENAEVANASMSGGITALFEPFITQPLDAIVMNQQLHHMNIAQTLRTLTFYDYYRATAVTGLLRNLPAGVALFGGAELFNHVMDNDDKQSNPKNIAAKIGAGFSSALASQPGDVLKAHMQRYQWSLIQALRTITLKQLLTNGTNIRLIGGGFKAGIGLWLAENAMNLSAQYFAKDSSTKEASRKRRRDISM